MPFWMYSKEGKRLFSDGEKVPAGYVDSPAKLKIETSKEVDKDFDRDTAIALLKEAGKNVHPNTGDAKLKAMLEEISA